MQSFTLALHAGDIDGVGRRQTGDASGTDREGQDIDVDAIGFEDKRQIALVVRCRSAWKSHVDTIRMLAFDLMPQFDATINNPAEESSLDAILEERVVIDQDRRTLLAR